MRFLIVLVAALLVPPIITVPRGNGNPVLVDGRFSPGEWDDARRVVVTDSVSIYVKQFRGHVYIFVRAPFSMLPMTDLYVQPPSGTVYNLHASAQLGERVFNDTSWTDTIPRWRWGNTQEWYANEVRTDRVRADSILAAHPQADRRLMRFETTWPYEGQEYQIRRSRFAGNEWRFRAEIMNTVGGEDVVYPAGSTRKQTSGWAILRL